MKRQGNSIIEFVRLTVTTCLLTACDMFDTHPYDVDFKGETGINARQIAAIESRFADKDTLRVAFISDTHLWLYIPWSINLGSIVTKKDAALIPADAPTRSHWSIEPLTASLYLNTVYGHEFWKSQPSRYPDKYYEFMSTKFRLNIALGQRVTVQIPTAKRKRAKSVSLFYEVSTCDLYIRSMFQTSGIPLKDILGLSLGVKLQTL